VLNPGPASTVDATDDTTGSSVAAQARENRGQGQDTAAAVRAANPSSVNSNAQQQPRQSTAQNFDTLDINRDGWVSLSELPVGNTTMSGSFSQYDSDGDSRLSRAEFDSFLTASDDSITDSDSGEE